MKATLLHHVIAESNDIVDVAGYAYFPEAAVRTDYLKKSPKTASDLRCPDGVQFYDVELDGKHHERAAWRYEAPRPVMQKVAGRFGFWGDVKVG
jgi:uncharacterized protein (DUF427 family)